MPSTVGKKYREEEEENWKNNRNEIFLNYKNEILRHLKRWQPNYSNCNVSEQQMVKTAAASAALCHEEQ